MKRAEHMTLTAKVFIGIAIVSVTLAAILFGIWTIAIPDELIVNWLKTSVERPLVLEVNGFRKDGLFAVKIKEIRLILLKNSDILVLQDCTIRVNPVFLPFNTVKVSFNAGLSGGHIKGSGTIKDGLADITGNMYDIELSGINYLKKFSLKGHGTLSGDFTFYKDTGELSFKIMDFAFNDIYNHGIYLPLKYFEAINGLFVLKNSQLTAESVTLSGKGIYARIKGKIAKGTSNIKVDIMPEDNFPDRDKLALIKNYEVSPGVYSIEIKKWLY
ncbi:MAG: type II secretion system protein GspN [Candidatus Magnetobacterium sp. LHC-1]|nr:type II secretion system protein GspN [Nitrospirota bacterium]